MKVLLTGGGTGGHIMPLLAVARKLKDLDSTTQLLYVGERSGKFADLIQNEKVLFSSSRRIFAGKFRRYNDEAWFQRILDIKTNMLNIRDLVFVSIGVLQSVWILLRERPKVVFIKGGFVGMPVGLAAALLRIPYVTHDSDTVPGLANRLIGRWARLHATGMPAEFYNYPSDKIRYTGIPVSADFRPVNEAEKKKAKTDLFIDPALKVVLVTGGSQGSRQINQAMVRIVPELLTRNDVYVIHHVGRGNEAVYENFQNPRLRIESFISPFSQVSAAADVVVARAGANTIAELAIQAKPLIIIPSPFLTGGHQLKNATHLQSKGAAKVIAETDIKDNPKVLYQAITDIIDQPQVATLLSQNLSQLAQPNAAENLAQVILEVAKK